MALAPQHGEACGSAESSPSPRGEPRRAPPAPGRRPQRPPATPSPAASLAARSGEAAILGELRAPPPPLPTRRDRPLRLRDAEPPLPRPPHAPPRRSLAWPSLCPRFSLPVLPSYLGRRNHHRHRRPSHRVRPCGGRKGAEDPRSGESGARVWLGVSVPEPVPRCTGPEVCAARKGEVEGSRTRKAVVKAALLFVGFFSPGSRERVVCLV